MLKGLLKGYRDTVRKVVAVEPEGPKFSLFHSIFLQAEIISKKLFSISFQFQCTVWYFHVGRPQLAASLIFKESPGQENKVSTTSDNYQDSEQSEKMESVIALEGDGFVIIAADVSNARSIVVMKDDVDKIRVLDDHKLFAAVGDPGDVSKFFEHIQKDVKLYNMRSGITISTAAMANYTRGELARFLRYVSRK